MKSRLGVCQLYFHLDPEKMTNEFDSLQITIQKKKLYIDSYEISLPHNVVPQSLNGLSIYKNELTFRIHLGERIMDPDRALVLSCNYREPISLLKINKTLMLQCMRCNCKILKNEFLLGCITSELTDMIDVSDIFCHREKNTYEFEKCLPRNGSTQWIHFETGSFKLMHFEEENLRVILEDVIRCKHCLSWLGIRSKNQGHYLHFWCDTVKFSSIPYALSQNQISKYLFYELIRQTLSDFFFTPCNFLMICKISAKEERCISLTILDKSDSVKEYNYEIIDNPKKYLKVIFEENDRSKKDLKSGIHQITFVSKPTFCYTLQTLYASCDTFSESISKVAYLPI